MKYEHKIEDLRKRGKLKCACWDHLRAVGITPTPANADKHRDMAGKIHSSVTGEADTQRTKSFQPQSEAEIVMRRGRGQEVD